MRVSSALAIDMRSTFTSMSPGSTMETSAASIAAIGSGGNYALAAARALVEYEADAETICRKAMKIAADVCVYTNENLTVETLESAA